jgi:hypothetical protein
LFGTKGCEIIEFENGSYRIFNKGHLKNQILGLCIDKKENNFITAG